MCCQALSTSHHPIHSFRRKEKSIMDKEQEEIQFLGFFGIFKESFKIISTYRKIFSQITLALILPLSFVFLSHLQISKFLFPKDYKSTFNAKEDVLHFTRFLLFSLYFLDFRPSNLSEWIPFFMFKLAYFIFFFILFLLSTSAIVYNIACIFTSKEITFKKIMSVVPKVWKRLLVTFLWNFIIVFIYSAVAIVLFFLWLLLIGPETVIGVIALVTFLILFAIGFICISVVWCLASVISVLEDVYGLKAMTKGKSLIKGKRKIVTAIFLLLILCFAVIQAAFIWFVATGESLGSKIGFGILCFLFLSMLILLGLVIQTIIYFICKSHHNENINKAALADHLEVYLGDYVPLRSHNVQLEPVSV